MNNIVNPILDLRPNAYVRDPALVIDQGVYHLFFTRAEEKNERIRLYLEKVTSSNLKDWSAPARLLDSDLNFSSPGNLIHLNGEWILCFQSYPITPGELWGNEHSRLWTMRSVDLENWSEPRVMAEEGCVARWANSSRQIDPFIIESSGKYYCVYKSTGKYGALVSDDLERWKEFAVDEPFFEYRVGGKSVAIENPFVIKDNGEFHMFVSFCGAGRGIGITTSSDLVHWSSLSRIDLPIPKWGVGGITAPTILKTEENESEKWLMVFHADGKKGTHEGALGVALGESLTNWRIL